MAKCVVKIVDGDGIQRSTEVEAKSLYDAAAKAIQNFKLVHIHVQNAKVLEIEQHVVITHQLPMSKIEKWSKSKARNDREAYLKERIRKFLGID